MNALRRWLRFNMVGAIGMVVQLASLAVLGRMMHGHYLWASAMAVELAVLHNFAWHVRYTWSDRREVSSARMQLVRFHLSNGLVSLVGNVALMRLLVQGAHLSLVIANLIAIICCSVVNFCVGDRWAFAAAARSCAVA